MAQSPGEISTLGAEHLWNLGPYFGAQMGWEVLKIWHQLWLLSTLDIWPWGLWKIWPHVENDSTKKNGKGSGPASGEAKYNTSLQCMETTTFVFFSRWFSIDSQGHGLFNQGPWQWSEHRELCYSLQGGLVVQRMSSLQPEWILLAEETREACYWHKLVGRERSWLFLQVLWNEI